MFQLHASTHLVAAILLALASTSFGKSETTTAAVAGAMDKTEETTSTVEESSELFQIGDKVVDEDELSSYAEFLASSGQRAEDLNWLANDYILTHLADELPTTAATQAKVSKAFPYSDWSSRTAIYQALTEHVKSEVKATPAQEREWYEANLKNYITPEQVKARHLFMQVSEDNPSSSAETVRTRLRAIRNQAESGTSFALLANRHSEAASGKEGGDIGRISRRMPIGPEHKPMNIKLEEALFKLSAGKVSDIIQTSHGLHLLFAEERTTTVTPTLEDFHTSRILPGAVEQNLQTTRILELRDATLKKHNGKVLLTSASADLTSTTPALEFGGNVITLQDLENVYEVRFKRAFESVRSNPAKLEEMMNQVLLDIAVIVAAVELGIDKKPEVQKQIKDLARRARAQKALEAVIAEQYPATEQQARDIFEKNKEPFRRHEAEGSILVAELKGTPSGAERTRALQKVQAVAETAQKKISAGAGFEQTAQELSTDDVTVTAGIVARHVIGSATTNTLTRSFDGIVSELTQPGQLSDARQVGNMFAVGRLTNRYPGADPSFDEFKPRFLYQARMENRQRAIQDIIKGFEDKGLIKWLPGAAKLGRAQEQNEGNARK